MSRSPVSLQKTLLPTTAALLVTALLGCSTPEPADPGADEPGSEAATDVPSAAEPAPSSEAGSETLSGEVPEPDMTDMEEPVAERLRETRAAVIADPQSAEAWGRFGMVAHAHELWREAEIAYRHAQRLDLRDARWPYYLGDVLSVVGTDLDDAADAFRRAMKLRPNYAPAHLRLGRVLMADNRPQEAARELRRALELEPDLQPARVTLAQIELSRGRLDNARDLLERLLKEEPRHAQALSTLGQVYMRQGRRDDARRIAERARDSVIYNLYSDPLMGEVVNEGVSSVLIWERAKAFLDNGNFEQAALGLAMVIETLPDNPEAHEQMAIASRELDRPQKAAEHLERVIELDPSRVDARVRLADLMIEYQRADQAIAHLEKALELAPEDPDAPWLLGRAQVLTGELQAGIETLDRAEASGREVPVWVHNDWGSALAQTGRPYAALEHFELALEADPKNPQSLFYAGLVLEAVGRGEEAVDHYCRSMNAQPNPLASGRLQALGRTCPSP